MKHPIYRIFLFGIMVLALAACSTSRRVTTPSSTPSKHSVWTTDECLVAKTNLKLKDSKKKLNISLGGNLKMKYNDVIQLSATYLLGIQVGTLEITPDNITLISRYTRQYAEITYPELSAKMGKTITFQDLQNIFWGEGEKFKVKGLEWKYGSFTQLPDNRPVPTEMELSFKSGSYQISLQLEMHNHKLESGWTTRSTFNRNSYTRLTSDEIIKIISVLTE